MEFTNNLTIALIALAVCLPFILDALFGKKTNK